MAEGTTINDSENDDQSEREMDESEQKQTEVHEDFKSKNEWVSFEEESEVPFLPQPAINNVHNLSSEKYIQRLERKLCKIKDPSKITGKNIVTALTEARESQMSNMMKNISISGENSSQSQTTDNMNWTEDVSESKCCCVSYYKYLFPKQAKTTQEIECLLDEDELAITSQEFEESHQGHQFILA